MQKKIFTLLLLLITVAFSYAQSVGTVFTVNGINYKITSLAPKEVEVTEHETFTGAANIPATVNYNGFYSVTAIGESAFLRCMDLTSVSIPNSVTAIKNGGFFWCNSLTSIAIPNSVKDIGASAFGYCSGLKEIIIPNSVVEIGNFAFIYCESVQKITIGSSVEFIGSGAFNYQLPTDVYCLPMQAPICGEYGIFYPTEGVKLHICETATGYGEEGGYWQDLLIVKDGKCNVNIKEIEEQPQFVIFPNPANTYFTLQLEETHLPQKVEIINLLGQTVKSLEVYARETRIDVANLPRGLYVVGVGANTRKLVIGN